jgi:Fic family protein
MDYLQEKLAAVESLRQKIEAYGPLSQEILNKIEYRFRLECNYHSNRQEGGTLTRAETKSVMVKVITVTNKPGRDIFEMRGHDKVMQEILKIGKGELNISERRIKEIHGAIIDTDEVTEGEKPGEWKKNYNEIINYRLEKFGFVAPMEVPEAMHKLLNWLSASLEKVKQKDKKAIHPVILAFEFHHRLLTIHPFFDGNGRTARLLSNLILTSNGYPPFYVTDTEKDTYNKLLADIQVYGGDPESFIGFMCDLLCRSLELTLDVIEGRDSELDDWEKKLSLLVTNLPQDEAFQQMRTKEAVDQVVSNSIIPVIQSCLAKFNQKFDNLFANNEAYWGAESDVRKIETIDSLLEISDQLSSLHERVFRCYWRGFKRTTKDPFSINLQVTWLFGDYKYALVLEANQTNHLYSRYYHQFYSLEEVDEITASFGEMLVEQIQKNL